MHMRELCPLHFICTKNGHLGCSELRRTWMRFVSGQWRCVVRLYVALCIAWDFGLLYTLEILKTNTMANV